MSYIDGSRRFYAGAGYATPYEWATHGNAPFTALARPLSECTVGVVTTSYFTDAQPDTFDGRSDHTFARPLADADQLHNDRLQWDKDETHTRDPETYLPLQRLAEAAAAGRIGGVSPRFYGVPTVYSHNHTLRHSAPETEQAMRADGVDVALLVPL